MMGKKMRRYLLGRWRDGIIAVNVVRETEKTIWFYEVKENRGRDLPRVDRERKRAWRVFYPTWSEAFVALKFRARERVRRLAEELKIARADEKRIRALKEPKR